MGCSNSKDDDAFNAVDDSVHHAVHKLDKKSQDGKAAQKPAEFKSRETNPFLAKLAAQQAAANGEPPAETPAE